MIFRPLKPDPAAAPLSDAELLKECHQLLDEIGRHTYSRKLLLGIHAMLKRFAAYKRRRSALLRNVG